MTPHLSTLKNCDLSFDFHPKSHWPEGLPAVAINHLVIAGFGQSLVFDHEIDAAAKDYEERFAQLFRSLHPDLTALELIEIWRLARHRSDIPLVALFETQHVRLTDTTEKICELAERFPAEVKNFLIEKRVSFGDLQPLASLGTETSAAPFFVRMRNLGASRAILSQAFELWVELRMMDRDLTSWEQSGSPDEALGILKKLRYPEALGRDDKAREALKNLPMPGQAQARWQRNGDRSGIEIKLFVGHPSDCKKWAQQFQDLERELKNWDLWGGH